MEINPKSPTKKYLFPQEVKTFIYQPNRVTKAIYDYTLMQEKVFNAVMYFLQVAIQKRMNGEDYTQLSLFQDNTTNDIKFEIPLKKITNTPQQYPKVIKALTQLAGTAISFPFYDENRREKRIRFTGLFRGDISCNPKKRTSTRYKIDNNLIENHMRPIALSYVK